VKPGVRLWCSNCGEPATFVLHSHPPAAGSLFVTRAVQPCKRCRGLDYQNAKRVILTSSDRRFLRSLRISTDWLYEAALKRRALRLAKLVSLENGMGFASPTVLGMFVGELLRVAAPLCGDQLRADMFTWLGRQLRASFDLCPFCGAAKVRPEALMCQSCAHEVAADEHEALLDAIDEARRPS